MDRFKIWLEAIQITNAASEIDAAVFRERWIARFDVPSEITTDQEQQFKSSLFISFSSLLGINHIRTMAYQPINNGVTENFHRSLKQSLKCHQH